jgi:hypothetical protein
MSHDNYAATEALVKKLAQIVVFVVLAGTSLWNCPGVYAA